MGIFFSRRQIILKLLGELNEIFYNFHQRKQKCGWMREALKKLCLIFPYLHEDDDNADSNDNDDNDDDERPHNKNEALSFHANDSHVAQENKLVGILKELYCVRGIQTRARLRHTEQAV